MLRDVVLPSGRALGVDSAPFKDSRRLYQALGGEFLKIDLGDGEADMANIIKNVLCLGFSSLEIEKALEPCLKRCLYNGVKIELEKTFEAEEAREDYLDICVEVAKENVRPFTKSLFAQFKGIMGAQAKLHLALSKPMQRGSSPISDSSMPAMEGV